MTQDVTYLSASEMAGLPGMPTSERGVRLRATSEQWPSRPREKRRGGGREYPVFCMPARAQAVLARKGRRSARAILVAAAVERILPRLRRVIERVVVREVAKVARRIKL
jgi:putative transposase